MKNYFTKTIQWALIFGFCMILIECGASNRLREYEFRDLTAAAVISSPLRPEVFTDPSIYIDKDNPLGSFLRIGSTIAREFQAEKARARLDSAITLVDVPERIRNRTVESSSTYLHYRPIEDYHNSDFLFNIYIQNYGIDAQSWESDVYFQIEVKVHLLDNKTGAEIWKTSVKEREPLSRKIFDSGSYTADNVFTAIALSSLSVEEMSKGFQYLADYTADQITKKLQKDFAKSREIR
ncbi:hypothetical protein AMJ80_00990 [bacterium SM23_31]|nr:MAG: hypothetical protein AMJ80_00990 [bacterium SM23_31]